MLEESFKGKNCEPALEITKELAQFKKDHQKAEQYAKEFVKEWSKDKDLDKLKEEWDKIRDKVKEILPIAKIEKEIKTRTSEKAKESEKWDDSGLFTKGQIKDFCTHSPLYQKIASRTDFPIFKGQSDNQYGETIFPKVGNPTIGIYHPTFETLSTHKEFWKTSLLGIEQQVAVEALVTIGHEWGHVYWREFMRNEVKEKWCDISAESYAKGKGYISKAVYGGDKIEIEDFCECVGYFEVNPEKLKEADRDKHDFIEKLYSSLKK
jgi:hypothetical protein